jgi:type II secretory pathway pseudopilin PulG
MSEVKKKLSPARQITIAAIICILGALAVIAIPNFIKARKTSQANTCINYLSQINSAKQRWASDHKKTANDIPTWDDLTPYLGRGDSERLKCPQGGIYTIGKVGEYPTCSLGTNVVPAHVLN